MEITGTVTTILPTEKVGKKDTEKGGIVIKYKDGDYDKTLCLDLWGKALEKFKDVVEGQSIRVLFSVESREYNGKYYTNASAWGVEVFANDSQPVNDLPF